MSKKPLDIIVITDTHYYSKKLGVDTPAYEAYSAFNQKTVKDSEEIITAAFNQIKKDDCKNVIFCGDATCDGDRDSHTEFINLLYGLQKSGKNVFAITSTHDYRENDITYKYTGDVKEEIPSVPRKELPKLYFDFGPRDAVSVFEDGMSYMSELDENYSVLALNSDNNGNGRSGYSEKIWEWIRSCVEKCRQENREVIAFTHHPILSPSPFYSLFGKNDLMADHDKVAEMLADLGIELVFTGHTHIHNNSFAFSEKGNVFYDVSTTTPAGYPGYYRKITIKEDCYEIKSEKTRECVPIKFNGNNLDEHLAEQFSRMIRRTLDAAASDSREMAEGLAGISVRKKTCYRYGWLIHPIAKFIKGLKFGKVWKWTKKETGLSKNEIKDIKDDGIFEFIIQLVMYLYAGDAPFTPDTPKYKIFMGFCAIVESILKALHIPFSKIVSGCGSLTGLIEPMLFNKGICDKEVVLPKKPAKKDIEKLCYKGNISEIKSRKGLPIVVITALILLLLIPFVPLILLILAVGFCANSIKYRRELKES